MKRCSRQLAKDHKFDAIIHFAGSIVVPESVADPLAYYLNNTVKTRSLIAAAVKAQIPRFVFSSTAAVYGNPQRVPVEEDAVLDADLALWLVQADERMDAARQPCGLWPAICGLALFQCGGRRSARAAPASRRRRRPISSRSPARRCSASGAHMDVFGSDYDTPDGTCLRDYIHVSDLAQAHLDALKPSAQGGARAAPIIAAMAWATACSTSSRRWRRRPAKPVNKRMAPRRAGDPAAIVAASEQDQAAKWAGRRSIRISTASSQSALAWERLFAPAQRGRLKGAAFGGFAARLI